MLWVTKTAGAQSRKRRKITMPPTSTSRMTAPAATGTTGKEPLSVSSGGVVASGVAVGSGVGVTVGSGVGVAVAVGAGVTVMVVPPPPLPPLLPLLPLPEPEPLPVPPLWAAVAAGSTAHLA